MSIVTNVIYIWCQRMAVKKTQKRIGWHPADIRAEVSKRGKTLSGLARDAGLDESACRVALIRPLPKAEVAIARFLDVPLHELWPLRWSPEGLRYRNVRVENYHDREQSHRQNVRAA